LFIFREGAKNTLKGGGCSQNMGSVDAIDQFLGEYSLNVDIWGVVDFKLVHFLGGQGPID